MKGFHALKGRPQKYFMHSRGGMKFLPSQNISTNVVIIDNFLIYIYKFNIRIVDISYTALVEFRSVHLNMKQPEYHIHCVSVG